MLKDEIRKKEDEERENARQRLFKAPEGKVEEKKVEKDAEELVEEDLKKRELPDDEDSDESERTEGDIKEEQNENNGNPPNDDQNGSTVEIIQPADLKPKHLGFTRTLLFAMFAAMIGTGAQFGYALGVMNAPSEVTNSLEIIDFNRSV